MLHYMTTPFRGRSRDVEHEATESVHLTHQLNDKDAEVKRSDKSIPAPRQISLCLLAIWMKDLIVVWYRQTEEGLYPPGIPGHFLSLCSGNGPGWHRPRIFSQSTHCCSPCGKAIALTGSFPSLRGPCLWQEKASLAFREMLLCVALCRRSCAGLVRMMRCWEEHPPKFKHEALHPLRISAVSVDMGLSMQILYLQRWLPFLDPTPCLGSVVDNWRRLL